MDPSAPSVIVTPSVAPSVRVPLLTASDSTSFKVSVASLKRISNVDNTGDGGILINSGCIWKRKCGGIIEGRDSDIQGLRNFEYTTTAEVPPSLATMENVDVPLNCVLGVKIPSSAVLRPFRAPQGS